MKQLAEALQSLEHTVKQQKRETPICSGGSAITGLTVPTKSLPAVQSKLMAGALEKKQTENSAAVPSQKPQQKWVLSNQETLQLLEFLDASFAALDRYGRKPDQLKEIAKLFIHLLRGYPLEKIKEGFYEHMRRESRMPTPADIINIIDPLPPVWKPDWAVYVGLKSAYNRGGLSRYSREFEYMERCEKWSLDNLSNYDAYQESRNQIAIYEQKVKDELHESETSAIA